MFKFLDKTKDRNTESSMKKLYLNRILRDKIFSGKKRGNTFILPVSILLNYIKNGTNI